MEFTVYTVEETDTNRCIKREDAERVINAIASVDLGKYDFYRMDITVPPNNEMGDWRMPCVINVTSRYEESSSILIRSTHILGVSSEDASFVTRIVAKNGTIDYDDCMIINSSIDDSKITDTSEKETYKLILHYMER